MLSDLAFHLGESAGTDVHVITSRQRYDDPSVHLAGRESVDGVEIHRVRGSSFGRSNLIGRLVDYLSFYAGAGWWLWRLVRRGDVVVAKTDPPLISVVAFPVCRLRGAVLVNWLQDLFPEVAGALHVRGLSGAVERIVRRVRNRSLRVAACNVAIGERMAARVIREGVPAGQVQVIPNWSDGGGVAPLPPEKNLLRTEWGLRERFVVGYSGNMGRAHEFDTLGGAIDLFADQTDGGSTTFLFVGGGHYRQSLEAQALQNGWQHVLFKPYQPRERLQQSLGVADVHVVVLRPELEGLIVPSKFYGIAAAGRPMIFIGDPQGEVAGLIRRHECGRVIASGNKSGLCQALAVYRDDEALRRRHGVNARAAFEACFDKPIALDAWASLLARVSRVA